VSGPVRAILTVGNQRFDSHVTALRITLGCLPQVGCCEATLPAAVRPGAEAGDGAMIELDAGDGAVAVVRGVLATLGRTVHATVVVIADAGQRLGRLRPTATYVRQSGRDVIRSLASDAGVEVAELDVDLDLPAYAAHARRAAAEHVAELAALAGAVAAVDADGRLRVVETASRPELALRHGRELLDFSVDAGSPPAARRAIVGSGPAGAADAPDALRPSLEPLAGGRAVAGVATRWSPAPVLRTPRAVSRAADAAERRAAGGSRRLRARCSLLPAVRPGRVLGIQDLPAAGGEGPWLIERVVHRIANGHAETRFEATSLAVASRFEQLAGAIGGLL
jgi:hypothetical protein